MANRANNIVACRHTAATTAASKIQKNIFPESKITSFRISYLGRLFHLKSDCAALIAALAFGGRAQ